MGHTGFIINTCLEDFSPSYYFGACDDAHTPGQSHVDWGGLYTELIALSLEDFPSGNLCSELMAACPATTPMTAVAMVPMRHSAQTSVSVESQDLYALGNLHMDCMAKGRTKRVVNKMLKRRNLQMRDRFVTMVLNPTLKMSVLITGYILQVFGMVH